MKVVAFLLVFCVTNGALARRPNNPSYNRKATAFIPVVYMHGKLMCDHFVYTTWSNSIKKELKDNGFRTVGLPDSVLFLMQDRACKKGYLLLDTLDAVLNDTFLQLAWSLKADSVDSFTVDSVPKYICVPLIYFLSISIKSDSIVDTEIDGGIIWYRLNRETNQYHRFSSTTRYCHWQEEESGQTEEYQDPFGVSHDYREAGLKSANSARFQLDWNGNSTSCCC